MSSVQTFTPTSKCKICEKTFPSRLEYDRHLENHPRKVPCKPCNKLFRDQYFLDEHYRGSPNHPNCPRCANRGFFNKRTLRDHWLVEHPEIRCSCGAKMYKDQLAGHLFASSHHPVCRACKMGFDKEEDYEQHLVEDHADSRCESCERGFETHEALTEHWASSPAHTRCDLCELGFPNDFVLKEHLDSEHADSTCDQCLRAFKSKEELVEHWKVSVDHPNCDICRRGFANNTALQEHTATEHLPFNHPVWRPLSPPSTAGSDTPSLWEVDPARAFLSTNESTRALSNPNTNAPSMHCRICHRPACKELTMTCCGHFFCYQCILNEVEQRGRCAACNIALLPFALFKADF
ncbi:hypothetical protein K435DRAFT_785351, partial [Dendrothele bispora CBS 962.96]